MKPLLNPLFYITLTAILPSASFAQSADVEKALYGFYKKHSGAKTLYCGCKLIGEQKADTKGCGLASPTRSWLEIDSVEWTTIISPKEIAQGMPDNACWDREPCMDFKTGAYITGHNCCISNNETYKAIFNDINLLAPVTSSVATYRNIRVSGEPNSQFYFGSCGFSTDSENYRVTNRAKGIEARARLLLHENYSINFPNEVLAKASSDSKKYPPTYFEKSLARSIKSWQGVANPYTIDDWAIEPKHYHNQEAINMLDKISELADVTRN